MTWHSEYSKKFYFYLLRSLFKKVILSHHKFQILHQELNLKQSTCIRVLRWKPVDFICCITILIVRNFQKKPSQIIFLDIQIHLQLSPITTGFDSSIKVSIKAFFIAETFSMEKWSVFFSAFEYWPSDIPKKVVYNVSPRFWNSKFSVTRVLVFCTLFLLKKWNLLRSIHKLKHRFSSRIRIIVYRKFQNVLSVLI